MFEVFDKLKADLFKLDQFLVHYLNEFELDCEKISPSTTNAYELRNNEYKFEFYKYILYYNIILRVISYINKLNKHNWIHFIEDVRQMIRHLYRKYDEFYDKTEFPNNFETHSDIRHSEYHRNECFNYVNDLKKNTVQVFSDFDECNNLIFDNEQWLNHLLYIKLCIPNGLFFETEILVKNEMFELFFEHINKKFKSDFEIKNDNKTRSESTRKPSLITNDVDIDETDVTYLDSFISKLIFELNANERIENDDSPQKIYLLLAKSKDQLVEFIKIKISMIQVIAKFFSTTKLGSNDLFIDTISNSFLDFTKPLMFMSNSNDFYDLVEIKKFIFQLERTNFEKPSVDNDMRLKIIYLITHLDLCRQKVFKIYHSIFKKIVEYFTGKNIEVRTLCVFLKLMKNEESARLKKLHLQDCLSQNLNKDYKQTVSLVKFAFMNAESSLIYNRSVLESLFSYFQETNNHDDWTSFLESNIAEELNLSQPTILLISKYIYISTFLNQKTDLSLSLTNVISANCFNTLEFMNNLLSHFEKLICVIELILLHKNDKSYKIFTNLQKLIDLNLVNYNDTNISNNIGGKSNKTSVNEPNSERETSDETIELNVEKKLISKNFGSIDRTSINSDSSCDEIMRKKEKRKNLDNIDSKEMGQFEIINFNSIPSMNTYKIIYDDNIISGPLNEVIVDNVYHTTSDLDRSQYNQIARESSFNLTINYLNGQMAEHCVIYVCLAKHFYKIFDTMSNQMKDNFVASLIRYYIHNLYQLTKKLSLSLIYFNIFISMLLSYIKPDDVTFVSESNFNLLHRKNTLCKPACKKHSKKIVKNNNYVEFDFLLNLSSVVYLINKMSFNSNLSYQFMSDLLKNTSLEWLCMTENDVINLASYFPAIEILGDKIIVKDGTQLVELVSTYYQVYLKTKTSFFSLSHKKEEEFTQTVKYIYSSFEPNFVIKYNFLYQNAMCTIGENKLCRLSHNFDNFFFNSKRNKKDKIKYEYSMLEGDVLIGFKNPIGTKKKIYFEIPLCFALVLLFLNGLFDPNFNISWVRFLKMFNKQEQGYLRRTMQILELLKIIKHSADKTSQIDYCQLISSIRKKKFKLNKLYRSNSTRFRKKFDTLENKTQKICVEAIDSQIIKIVKSAPKDLSIQTICQKLKIFGQNIVLDRINNLIDRQIIYKRFDSTDQITYNNI